MKNTHESCENTSDQSILGIVREEWSELDINLAEKVRTVKEMTYVVEEVTSAPTLLLGIRAPSSAQKGFCSGSANVRPTLRSVRRLLSSVAQSTKDCFCASFPGRRNEETPSYTSHEGADEKASQINSTLQLWFQQGERHKTGAA